MASDSLIHSLAGAAGGIVATAATYPLITLSTRAAVETKKTRPTHEAILHIIKYEGALGLYSGLGCGLWAIAITNGVYYYFYERTRAVMLSSRGGNKALSTAESMLLSFIAGSATSVISNPAWVIQSAQTVAPVTQDQEPPTSSQPPPVKRLSIIETARKIFAEGGYLAFWRGIGPSLVLVINPIIQYTVFEQLKNLLVRRRVAKLRAAGASAAAAVLTDLDFFLLGALSKLMASSITYPYLVVKSRMQSGHPSALRYKSSIHGLMTIVKEEGVEGVYKGMGSKLTQSVLNSAILFAGQKKIYEVVKRVLAASPIKKH